MGYVLALWGEFVKFTGGRAGLVHLLDFCYYRNWRKTLAIWLAAVPCVIFLGYYLM